LNNDVCKSKPKGPPKRKPSLKKLRDVAQKSLDDAAKTMEELGKIEESEEAVPRNSSRLSARNSARPMSMQIPQFLGELQGRMGKKEPESQLIEEPEEKEDEPVKRVSKNPARFSRPHTIIDPTMHKNLMDDLFKNNPKFKKSDEDKEKSSTGSLKSDSGKSASKIIVDPLNELKKSTEKLFSAEKVDTDATNPNNIKILNQIDDVLKTCDKVEALDAKISFNKVVRSQKSIEESRKSTGSRKSIEIKKPVETKPLFSSDEDDLFGESKTKIKKSNKNADKPLFDDDNDDEDFLGAGSKKVLNKQSGGVFGSPDEDEDLFSNVNVKGES
jgi:hypothetical protein